MLQGQGEEDAALQEEQTLIDENITKGESDFWEENEHLVDNDSDDGREIDDHSENTSEQIKNAWICVLTTTLAED